MIARPMSQPRLVASVKTRKRCRFSSTGAPATNDRSPLVPVVNGQNDRLRASRRTGPTPHRTPRAERPRPARAAAAAVPRPDPTHAAPSIWNGSQGPTPPVTSADANRVVAPSTKPNPAPNTRPPSTSRKNTVSRPGRAGAERSQRGTDGGEHAEHRDGLDVEPPSLISASTTASSSGSTSAKSSGASVPCAEPGCPGATMQRPAEGHGHRPADTSGHRRERPGPQLGSPGARPRHRPSGVARVVTKAPRRHTARRRR